jgi:CBS domain containing-hemolysin-like protein
MAEAAFFSIPKLTLGRLKSVINGQQRVAELDSLPPDSRSLHRIALVDTLLGQPTRLLGAILISDTIFSVSLSSVVALLAEHVASRYQLPEALTVTAGAIVLIFVLLVLGETVPKLIALRNPLRIASGLGPVVSVLDRALSPISRWLDLGASRVLTLPKPAPFPSEAELKTMLEVGQERGVIKGSEEEILWNLVELDKRTVSEIMTPRIDVKAIPADMTISQAMEIARRTMHSRFPVYEETIDHVVGIFYIKDYLRLEDDTAKVVTACREPYLIPETKSVPALLDELRRLGIHIAVVVDEFGQTAGLVTLEDVLEALFGEIRDEYDLAEPLPYLRLPDGSYSVDGDIDLKALNRLFRNLFRGQESERLSGFIHHELGRLPESGDMFEFRGFRFEVTEVNQNQIGRVIIRRLRPRSAPPNAGDA